MALATSHTRAHAGIVKGDSGGRMAVKGKVLGGEGGEALLTGMEGNERREMVVKGNGRGVVVGRPWL